MEVDWEELRAVLVLVRNGSLAKAAAELGVNYTTVARRVARAETHLGTPLFERLADGYQPTEDARIVAQHAAAMENAQISMLREFTGRDRSLSGPLVVTAPQLLIAHFLAPAIDQFCTLHPGVALRLRASNDRLDLTRREADLALRISADPGDTLTGLRLTSQHSASFASQVWADRIADDPSGPIDWIIYDRIDGLPQSIVEKYPGSRIKLRFDDMVAMLGAAQAGLGVVRTPMFLGRSVPGLVQVPPLPPQPYPAIWMVGHPDVWRSAKVEAFRTVLSDWFRSNQPLFVG